jgi:hypothetical protein
MEWRRQQQQRQRQPELQQLAPWQRTWEEVNSERERERGKEEGQEWKEHTSQEEMWKRRYGQVEKEEMSQRETEKEEEKEELRQMSEGREQVKEWERTLEEERKEVAEKEDWDAWKELVTEEGQCLEEEEREKERLGARLMMQKYVEKWREIGCEWMVASGCHADWSSGPPPTPRDYTRRECYVGKMHEAMCTAIKEELQRGVIKEIPAEQAMYVLAAFVVVKPNKIRLILDGRPINQYIRQQSFKMHDWLALKQQILQGYSACTLDFSSAFHHLGLQPHLQKFLNFRYSGSTYQYVGLPFGLRSAPRLFCQAMGATMNAIRARWDVLASAYMDDVCIMAADGRALRQTIQEIVLFCEGLGWTVNKQKSVLEPSTSFTYLGLRWDTMTMTVRMTTEKNTALKTTVKRYIRLTRSWAEIHARDIAKLIGQLSAARPQHEEASLYLAKLNRLKCTLVRRSGWDARGTLTRALLPELHWWLNELRNNTPNDIRPFEATVTLFTDASETGWGATLRRRRGRPRWMFGWWSEDEVEVNCLREVAAVVKTVKRAVQKHMIMKGEDVLIHSDNTAVVFNLHKKRSGWRMRAAVKDFLKWLKAKRIRVQCAHVKGEVNVTADALSRLSRSGDYSLRPGLLAKIEALFGVRVEVDLFATRRNRQCTRYATAENTDADDLDVIARNAMSIPWAGWVALIHPPIPMLPQCLAKIRTNGTTAILVAPRWRGAPWMHSLRPLLVTRPIVLGPATEVLVPGPGMAEQNASLPPGDVWACLLKGGCPSGNE